MGITDRKQYVHAWQTDSSVMELDHEPAPGCSFPLYTTLAHLHHLPDLRL